MSRFSSLLVLIPVTLFLLLTSCEPTTQEGDDQSSPASDSLAAQQAKIDCMSRPDHICEDGLALAPLGSLLAYAGVEGLEPQDSIEAEQGYVWLSRTLSFADGSILIEGQFIDERQYNDTLVSESIVNRLRINSPSFRTAQNIRVGSSVLDLQQTFPDSTFLVDVVPGYPVLQVRLSSSHILYLVSDQAFSPSPEQDYPSFDRLDPYAEITSIVVM